MKDHAVVYRKCAQLDCNHRNCSIEKAQNIEEAGGNMLGYYHRMVGETWSSLSFNIPIFDGSDDVTCIKFAQHHFYFVIGFVFWITQQEINSSTNRLTVFAARNFQFSESQD